MEADEIQRNPLQIFQFAHLFTAAECSTIVALMKSLTPEPGVAWNGSDFVSDPSLRKVTTVYTEKIDTLAWVFDRLEQVLGQSAMKLGFEVDGMREPLKFLQYGAGDHFSSWHADCGMGYASLRKVSVSVELSDPADYTGGVLEIFPDYSSTSNPARQGSAVVFPSFRYHRVTPVLSGTRYALVNWTSGPGLR